MTDLEGMHSYFWLTSSRLRKPLQDDVPYTTQALRADLLRVRLAWADCQASRDRNAIYGYLTAVFDLVMWWAAEDWAISRARWTLRFQGADSPTTDEPFAAIILCTADRKKVDKRTRSKWSRVCDTQQSTRRAPSRLPPSFCARVASTNVRSDLPGVWGDADEITYVEHTPVSNGSRILSRQARLRVFPSCKAKLVKEATARAVV